MKKVLLIFISILFVFLAGCSTPKSEYTIDEFSQIKKEVLEDIQEKTKYYTVDEMNLQYVQLLTDGLKEKNVKLDSLTLRGIFDGSFSGIIGITDGNEAKYVSLGNDTEIRYNELLAKASNESFWLEDGESVVIKGGIAPEIGAFEINNTEIISPDVSNRIRYVNNVSKVCNGNYDSGKIVSGTLVKLIPITEREKEALYDEYRDSEYQMFYMSYSLADYIGIISADDNDSDCVVCLFSIMTDYSKKYDGLREGVKISVKGMRTYPPEDFVAIDVYDYYIHQ